MYLQPSVIVITRFELQTRKYWVGLIEKTMRGDMDELILTRGSFESRLGRVGANYNFRCWCEYFSKVAGFLCRKSQPGTRMRKLQQATTRIAGSMLSRQRKSGGR